VGIIVDKENRKEIAKRNYRLQPYFLAEARGVTEMGKPKSMSVIKVIPLCYLIRPNAKSSLHYDFGRTLYLYG
jgi:hypothetical protein